MRTKWTALLALLLVLLTVGTALAYPPGRLISAYTADAAALGGGVVGIEFDVSARRRMGIIGAQADIYTGPALIESQHIEDRDAYAFGLTRQVSLIPGYRYYIEITVFVRDYSGQEDRRTEGFYVTA